MTKIPILADAAAARLPLRVAIRLLEGIVRTEDRRKVTRASREKLTEGDTSPSRPAPVRAIALSVSIEFSGVLKVA